jgi:hypothetical protein
VDALTGGPVGAGDVIPGKCPMPVPTPACVTGNGGV